MHSPLFPRRPQEYLRLSVCDFGLSQSLILISSLRPILETLSLRITWRGRGIRGQRTDALFWRGLRPPSLVRLSAQRSSPGLFHSERLGKPSVGAALAPIQRRAWAVGIFLILDCGGRDTRLRPSDPWSDGPKLSPTFTASRRLITPITQHREL